jgi:hypothetical protein
MSIAQSVFDAPARGIVLFAVAAFVAWILCDRDARSRHLIWTFAIICQFALLAFVNIPSRWHVSVPISVPEGSTRVISNAVQHQAPATSIHADEPSHPIQFVLTHLRTPVIWYVAGSVVTGAGAWSSSCLLGNFSALAFRHKCSTGYRWLLALASTRIGGHSKNRAPNDSAYGVSLCSTDYLGLCVSGAAAT